MSRNDVYGSTRSEFPSDVKYGTLGEEFFYKYKGVFLRSFVLPNTDIKVNKREGMDYYFLQVGKEIIRSAGLEVKTFGNMSVLRYGITGREELTLPFELFSCESGKNVPREQWSSWGWLRQMFHPKEYNEMREREGSSLRAVMPGTLAYLICESERKDEVHPFVCIAIENFCRAGRTDVQSNGLNDLVDDLKLYASETLGLDLVNWNLPDATDTFWQQPSIKRHVHENLWNVPFSIIKRHGEPTITLIDQLPTEETLRQKIDLRYISWLTLKTLKNIMFHGLTHKAHTASK